MKNIEITVNKTDYKIFPSGSRFDLFKLGTSASDKPTESNMGYHMALSNCIDKIAKDSMSSADEVLTLKEYVDRYTSSMSEVKELLNEFEF